MVNIAINGFGRIGRTFFRVIFNNPDYKIVAINDLSNIKVSSHLLKYDSIHGRFPFSVSCDDSNLIVENEKIPFFNFSENKNLPWKDLSVDLVIEATGIYLKEELAFSHIKSGAKKVIITAPPKDKSIKTIVLGVNDNMIEYSDSIISNASCTTNCAAPMIKILNDSFKIEKAYVTTIHSYTTDQNLHDSNHNDLRRARSAPNSIIPTTTGAAKALSNIFPKIKIGGCGIRVPVSNGSLTDITCLVRNKPTVLEVNKIFREASLGLFSGILSYSKDPIVSVDVLSSPFSCVFDSKLTYCLDNMVKIVGWYDNEYGYSNRLVDLSDILFKNKSL